MADDSTDNPSGGSRSVRGRPFERGRSGNPGGRAKGARNRLGEAFLDDVRALWATDGPAVLREARAERPMDFARMVAGLLPKELLVRTAPEDEMTDAELADALDALRAVARRH